MRTIADKKETYSYWRKQADDWFSLFIRARDAGPDGYLNCFICGKRLHWKKQAQCMHYGDRDNMSLRYDEINCNSGCEECNCYDPNHRKKYAIALLMKFGKAAVFLLDKDKHSFMKFTRYELKEIAEKYKSLFNEIKKAKKL